MCDLWLLDVARDVTTRLTFDPGADAYPTWSADGTTIYFSSTRRGGFRVFQKSAGGTGDERELALPPGDAAPHEASRDGRMLAVVARRSNDNWGLAMVALDANNQMSTVLDSRYPRLEPSFSPDGKWLAYSSNESGVFEVYVVDYPGLTGKWQISTGGGCDPRWAASGAELFFLQPQGVLMSVPVTTAPSLRVNKPVRLFDVAPHSTAGRDYAATSDGKRFLVRMLAGPQIPTPVTVVQDWTSALRRR